MFAPLRDPVSGHRRLVVQPSFDVSSPSSGAAAWSCRGGRRARCLGRLAALGVAGLVAAGGVLAGAAGPTVEYALGLAPVQPSVDYDRPAADAATRATIKMEVQGGLNAWVVRGAGGEVLRSFADTNNDRVVDRWSYFKDGIEVYRDIDSDFDSKPDQSRWLNAAGSRWGIDADGNGKLDSWKVLSAEEATAEIVAALRDRDAAAFARLLPSKAELEAAGFTEPLLSGLADRASGAEKAFRRLVVAKAVLPAEARWNNMLAGQPGTLPAGSDGLKNDIHAYDNVVALVDSGDSGGQIYVGSLVRFGDVWRPIDAPQIPGAGGEIAEPVGFFAPRVGGEAGAGPMPAEDERIKPLLAKLRDVEAKLAAAAPADRAALAAEQVKLLETVVADADPAQNGFWQRQLIETVAAGVQDGSLPDGLAGLEKLEAAVADDPAMAAFVAFRLASSRYAAAVQQPGADVAKIQTAWLEELAAFVEKYPEAPDTAEALLQLAIADEFEGREKEALERYGAIATGFPDVPAAQKARGAARRLESVGKALSLSGTSLDGKPVALKEMRGVPVLVHYWATWCEPCKVDIAQIRELYAKYGPKRFGVVGICLDTDKQQLARYLAAKPIPWPQLHETGGLDGPLAQELGVLTLPTMLLLDAQGKVVDRSLVITDLEKKLEELLGGK
jgi:thiol-disulfide isomerase/thioredoxin